MQYRTHTCNELRLGDAGKRVRLSGWMENIREVSGNLAFIVLRDFYGSTQLVAENEQILRVFLSLNKESVVSVTGTVRERANKNPKWIPGISRWCRKKWKCSDAAGTMRCPSRSAAAGKRTKAYG